MIDILPGETSDMEESNFSPKATFQKHLYNPMLFFLDIFVSLQFSDLGTVVKSRGRIW